MNEPNWHAVLELLQNRGLTDSGLAAAQLPEIRQLFIRKEVPDDLVQEFRALRHFLQAQSAAQLGFLRGVWSQLTEVDIDAYLGTCFRQCDALDGLKIAYSASVDISVASCFVARSILPSSYEVLEDLELIVGWILEGSASRLDPIQTHAKTRGALAVGLVLHAALAQQDLSIIRDFAKESSRVNAVVNEWLLHNPPSQSSSSLSSAPSPTFKFSDHERAKWGSTTTLPPHGSTDFLGERYVSSGRMSQVCWDAVCYDLRLCWNLMQTNTAS
jgi:hypothetical protein